VGRRALKALGIEGNSKSQASTLAKNLDRTVAAFRSRPLDGGPYTYIWLDALAIKFREAGGSSPWPAWSAPA
jgi:putative transposase